MSKKKEISVRIIAAWCDHDTSSAEDHDQTHLPGNSAAYGGADAEYISLHLPSHFGHDSCHKNAAKDLAKAELCL